MVVVHDELRVAVLVKCDPVSIKFMQIIVVINIIQFMALRKEVLERRFVSPTPGNGAVNF